MIDQKTALIWQEFDDPAVWRVSGELLQDVQQVRVAVDTVATQMRSRLFVLDHQVVQLKHLRKARPDSKRCLSTTCRCVGLIGIADKNQFATLSRTAGLESNEIDAASDGVAGLIAPVPGDAVQAGPL